MPRTKDDNLRAKFLKSSAKLLTATGPSTSAHLMSEHISTLLNDQDSSLGLLREEICIACGTLSLREGTTSVVRKQKKRGKRAVPGARKEVSLRSRTGGDGDGGEIVLKCSVCNQKTVIALPAAPQPAKVVVSGEDSAILTLSPGDLPERATPKSGDKMSSKKRAKARKERDGLQALLAQSKKDKVNSSSTLDLTDLMKARTS